MNVPFAHFLERFMAIAGKGADGLNLAAVELNDGAGATLPSVYAVTDFAAASIAAAGLAAKQLSATLARSATDQPVQVDRRLSSLWFANTIEPIGWEIPGPWDAIAGNYLAGDRFVRLHTNAPAHRAAALEVLGCEATRDAVTAAVADWDAFELHEALVAAGGVGAAMRTRDEWLAHPQGQALKEEPLVHHDALPAPAAVLRTTDPERPLAGVRVLDLTRVLAGPVATRFLAGLGADVLRVDPPTWNEPGVVPDVNRGKRCVRLDLRSDDDRTTFEHLLTDADILVHGYRRDALDGLGYGSETRRTLNPGLVDVSLDAYGHTGPWADRRGFDSVVQVAAGIAAEGMRAYGTDVPKPLPVQALDHATGYTLAASAVSGWRDRLESGVASTWRTSLAAHGELLCSLPAATADPSADLGLDRSVDFGADLNADFADHASTELAPETETTSWGPARRVQTPVVIPGVTLRWERGSADHGSTAQAAWL